MVAELGLWDGNRWIWCIPWRRQLFEWEKYIEAQLIQSLDSISLIKDQQDSVKWKWRSNSKFIVKSCTVAMNQHINEQVLKEEVVKEVWFNGFPPRAQLLA